MHETYLQFMQEYQDEAQGEMSNFQETKARNYIYNKMAQTFASSEKEDLSYLDGVLEDSEIKKDGEPVELHLSRTSVVAKLIAKISKKAAENQKRFRDYSVHADNVVVGDLSINIDSKDTVNIIWIGIKPKYRGNGYAQSVLRLIIGKIIESGFKYVTLEVPGDSKDAHHIYQKIGFVDGEQISDESDVWGGLTSMKLDVNDYKEPQKKTEPAEESAESNYYMKMNAFDSEDYYTPPKPGDNIEWEDLEDIEEAGNSKEGVYKENFYLRDHLQTPYITKALKKSATQDKIIEFTGTFIDNHSYQLSTSGPVHSFTLGQKEIQPLYDLFGVTDQMMIDVWKEMVNDTYYGKISSFFNGWVENAPHKILLTVILIDAIQNNYEDIRTCCEYLWAFVEYPIVYHMFWRLGVKEDVMNYTIEHLGTKFKVKKVNNLQELLKYDANSSVNAQYDKLKAGVDNVYADLMHRMRNQLKNTFKNIANAYYDNDEKNATQHTKDSQFDDGSLADQEGHSTNIAQVVDRTVNKFTTGGINNSFVRACAEGNQVDKDNLAGYINQIWTAKNNKIPKFIENVITSYFNRNPTDTSAGGSEFINFGITLYRSISTSKDPMYQEIRLILNYWMFDIINIRNFYQREGTVINYTRAIFNYMIFMIAYYN
ncbi:MAG: GNAT family N-acetyltransferase [Lachnospiraceae bacterium]|nr:GNAT family N-acetyltransferase [Lachnospiraceae bacterium]MCM1232014.1 GNAT family N-acetyltransferase [Ruminococcus flavefaciens]